MSTKLYCYVDESGQDTQGRFFVVVAVILAGEQEGIRAALERIEGESGKGRMKWTRSRRAYRQRYLELVAQERRLRHSLYSKVYRNAGRAYQELTTLAIAQALTRYCHRQQIEDYSATIIVDGLNRAERPALGANLRRLGVTTRKVRGARDEGEAVIRLADAVAGLVRGADGGDGDLQAALALLIAAEALAGQ